MLNRNLLSSNVLKFFSQCIFILSYKFLYPIDVESLTNTGVKFFENVYINLGMSMVGLTNQSCQLGGAVHGRPKPACYNVGFDVARSYTVTSWASPTRLPSQVWASISQPATLTRPRLSPTRPMHSAGLTVKIGTARGPARHKPNGQKWQV